MTMLAQRSDASQFKPRTEAKSAAPLVILRREYLEWLSSEGSTLVEELPKGVIYCAAKLIDYFLHWRTWKLSTQRTDWIYQPLKRIREDLMGEHSLHVIRDALDLLRQLGVIKRRNNPGNRQDRTYQYQVQMDVVPRLDTGMNLSVANDVRLESGEVRSESADFNAEKSYKTQLPTKIIKSNKQVEDLQEEVHRSETLLSSREEGLKQTLLNEIQSIGITLTPNIERVVTSKIAEFRFDALPLVRNAITAVKQQIQQGVVQNPMGLMIKAIEKNYTPNPVKQTDLSSSPRQDYVSRFSEITGYPDDILCRQQQDQSWVPIDPLPTTSPALSSNCLPKIPSTSIPEISHRDLTSDEQEWLALALKLGYRTNSDLDWDCPDDPEIEISEAYWNPLPYEMKANPLEALREEAKFRGLP